MKKIKPANLDNVKKANTDSRYLYQDVKSYFESLEKAKLIKKATYSIVYHPMLLLSKSYNVKVGEESYKHMTLKTDHIILLSYLMGYVKDSRGSETFWGSNNTIASDLGVCDRTVQRWLRELEKIGFVKTIIQNKSERYIYVNFSKILTEIYKCINDEFDDEMLEKACELTTLCCIKKGVLESTRLEIHSQTLYNKYLHDVIKNDIPDTIKYLFETSCSMLEIKMEQLEDYYNAAKARYIELVNRKNPISKKDEIKL